MALDQILEYEEGYRDEVYTCSNGYPTVGIGTKISTAKGLKASDFCLLIDRETAVKWMNREVCQIIKALINGPYSDIYDNLSQQRKNIILSMCYQMGVQGVYGFKNMWKALYAEDYEEAASEMLDSKWHKKDTKFRAERHADVMKSNSYRVYPFLEV